MRKFSISNLIEALTEYVKQGGKLPFSDKKEENVTKIEDKKVEERAEQVVQNHNTSYKNNELLIAIQNHDAFVEKVKKEQEQNK